MNEAPRGGIVHARRVLTLVPGLEGESLWWEDGKVRGVGSARELDLIAPPSLPRYVFPEALVTPGFVDSHTHFGMWALGRTRVNLVGARTRVEALRRVGAAQEFQGWVLGHGWNANGWEEPPDRWELDRIHPGPVCLDSVDVHAVWVNTAALAAAGISRHTPDPVGGRIVRDAAGEPTGVLLERAVALIQPAVPRPSHLELSQLLRAAQAEAHRLGVTAIHDVEGPDVLRAFRGMEADGSLRLRVLFHPPVAQLPMLTEYGVSSGSGSEWLTLGGIKLFLDGSLGSRTAWMLEPYQGGSDRGMPTTSEDEARQAVQTASRAGLACTIHAIGDAAVRRALDLLSQAPRVAIPHRIEHVQCIHPDDLGRLAAHGIVASMQPAHLLDDIRLAEAHWGARSQTTYAFGALARKGTVLAFGSDVPVATLDPRQGIYAAMARQGQDGWPAAGWYREERLDFEQVLRGYTVGGAIAAGVAGRRGTLAVGMDADLVAWDVDAALEEGDADAIRNAAARLTVVGGEVVMRS